MEIPKFGNNFLVRTYKETTYKVLLLVLQDQTFTEDVRQAESFADYLQFLREKGKRTTFETIFLIAPDEEQNKIWSTIRGASK
jgi:hypothetical protein